MVINFINKTKEVNMHNFIHSKLLLIAAGLILLLAGCNLPGRTSVEITITSPENGQAILLGQETRIVSLATARRGIESVELYINGELLETATPPEGYPEEFTADQPFTPAEEGNLIVSVLAIDTRGNKSQPMSISLQVVQTLEDSGASPEATITLTPEGLAQTQTAALGCSNEAVFVSDLTIPANTVLTAGANFTKIWRVTNTGSCDWVGYQLVHASGDLMGASSPQALPLVNAGANGDLSVELTAPGSPGAYTAIWRMRASDGAVYGPDLAVTIIVPQPPTSTPNPTATFTPTVTVTPTATANPISITQEGDSRTLNPGQTVSPTVSCPAGSVVVSGGYAANDGVRVWHSKMVDNGWQIYAYNTTGVSKLVNIYAVCLHNSGGATELFWDYKDIAPNNVTQIIQACPAGSLVTGGGWVIGTNPDVSIYNSSKSGNGWQIYVNNAGGSSPQVNVYAICLSGVSGTTASINNTGNTVPANDVKHVAIECPSGSYVTGGGFATNLEVTIYNESISGNSWNEYGRNNAGTSKTLNGYAICYSP